MGQILRNYIKTKREFKIFYKKSIEVLLEIILGNIKKERLKLKKLNITDLINRIVQVLKRDLY